MSVLTKEERIKFVELLIPVIERLTQKKIQPYMPDIHPPRRRKK
jgi:hypothetical protein